MAALSDAERLDAMRAWIKRAFVDAGATARFDGGLLKSTVDATDDWFEANLASLNSAFPAVFRTNATLPEKALMVAYVALKKGGVF